MVFCGYFKGKVLQLILELEDLEVVLIFVCIR